MKMARIHVEPPTAVETATTASAGMGHSLPVPFYFMVDQKFMRELL